MTTTSERYYAVAHGSEGMPDEETLTLYDRIERAVPDYDALKAEGTPVRMFGLIPIDDGALYDWGVSSDAIPEVTEYTGERSARSWASGMAGGRVFRRRIGSDTWEEVDSRD
jgi:hypothetical protein